MKRASEDTDVKYDTIIIIHLIHAELFNERFNRGSESMPSAENSKYNQRTYVTLKQIRSMTQNFFSHSEPKNAKIACLHYTLKQQSESPKLSESPYAGRIFTGELPLRERESITPTREYQHINNISLSSIR